VGQDHTVIFVAERVPAEKLAAAARQAFAGAPPRTLVLLYGYSGPEFVEAAFPQFTALSAWADNEESPAPLATQLSAEYGRALAITMVDHAGVGAWQAFVSGQPKDGYSTEGEDYSCCGLNGIETLFGVKLDAPEEEKDWFTESLTDFNIGICVFGAGPLRPGQVLRQSQIKEIQEYDFDGAELECMLA
jgi:hypothetical protein